MINHKKNNLKQELENSKSIVILLSKNPYLDQVAAGLSLYLTLEKSEKNINIACPSPMLVEYNRLVGVNKIVSGLGDKNLVIKFKGYPAQNIEKVTYDIEEEEFRLSIIPKADASSPTQDQVTIDYAGVSADTIILIGGGNESHFPDLKNEKFANAKLIHIGKQDVSATSSREVVSFTKQSSSVSEIVAEIIKEFNPKFTEDIATNLLMGIREGSRDFSHSWVNADTFKLASELMSAGGKSHFANASLGAQQDKNAFNKPDLKKSEGIKKTEEPKVDKPVHENGQTNGEASPPPPPAPASWLEPKIFKGTTEK